MVSRSPWWSKHFRDLEHPIRASGLVAAGQCGGRGGHRAPAVVEVVTDQVGLLDRRVEHGACLGFVDREERACESDERFDACLGVCPILLRDADTSCDRLEAEQFQVWLPRSDPADGQPRPLQRCVGSLVPSREPGD